MTGNQQRPQRAATQGGHIFGGQMGRSHAYGQMGSKLNKIHQNQQKFAATNMHDNSLSNGYLMYQHPKPNPQGFGGMQGGMQQNNMGMGGFGQANAFGGQ